MTTTENVFVKAASLAYKTGKQTGVTMAKVCEMLLPVIRDRMDAAGAVRSTKDEDPPTSGIVRRVTMGFYVEFFNAHEEAMADLRAVAARKGMGFEKIADEDHMELILGRCGAMSSMSTGLKYFDDAFRKTRNGLGYRERKDRKGGKAKEPAATAVESAAPTAAEAAANAEAVAEAIKAKEGEMTIALPVEFDPNVILDLLNAYGVEKGEDCANWIAVLESAVSLVKDHTSELLALDAA